MAENVSLRKNGKEYAKLPALERQTMASVESPVPTLHLAEIQPTPWKTAVDPATNLKYFYRTHGERIEIKFEPPLPIGWSSAINAESGDPYYYSNDGKVSWDIPEEPVVAVASKAGVSRNTTDEEKMAQLNDLLRMHEIRPDFLQRLLQLEEYEIALILDNSGSMDNLSDAPMPSGFTRYWSRWEELKHIAKILIPIANVFDTNGVDMYFFDKTINNYKDISSFDDVAGNPGTSTPLTETLNALLASKENLPAGKKLLIFIITDGVPNGGPYYFKEALLRKADNVYVTILACNNDERAIGYLNEIDDTVDRVDCVDDYTSEKKEIHYVQGKDFPFSYGDYIIKALLGSVDPIFDNLDEKNLLLDAYIVKSDEHISVKKGATSIDMGFNVRSKQKGSKKWKLGTKIFLKTATGEIDVVTIESISKNGMTIAFTPALKYDHHTTGCMPGSVGCFPGFWGGRTRRRSNKSRAKRLSNKSRTRSK